METINSVLPLLILISPLIGFFINAVILPLGYRGFAKTPANLAGGVATFFIGASFVMAIMAFTQLSGSQAAAPSLLSHCFEWFNFGGLNIPFDLRIDKLSGLLVLIITGIGTLIHLYSISYMHDEECVGRYFSYLNLFCFNMLLLVLGDNLPLLFFGWEGVGLCSYLLIGFWYTDTEKANAGKKAFIVNRIGDLGFLIGMFMLFRELGTLTLPEINTLLADPNVVARIAPSITMICLSLFVGATGKSAQMPLFVWLPDAMSGPTPVSALIHAATMVTAGVYMIARLNILFELSPVALSVIAHVGALTAIFAGSIAVAQTDIKKVLAYSTVSQLGFMFLACGVGAYQTAVFHLMTHAFFKALLFLGSGSVIHACSGEQDMTKMGGLKKYLPHTHITMLVGSLAISGVPFFSGFFSKDEILYSTIALPGGISYLFIVGVITACLTAFYTGRMMSLTFYGNERMSHDVKHHLHESPGLMTGPLYALAGLAAFGGFLGVPHLLGDFLGHMPHYLSTWLDPVVPSKHLPLVGVKIPLHEGLVMAGSSIIAVGSYLLGVKLFKKVFFVKDLFAGFSSFHKVLEHKYYVDEFYDLIIVRPLRKISAFAGGVIDKYVVDGAVNGIGRGVRKVGSGLRMAQTGDVQSYGLMMLGGVIAIMIFIFKVLN
ncbi:MAG TPA: NADH-quinone oxidoreductase subunit L [Bacteriovoracaceae bacterium]|nr:NADH-quinone oxidoreductase subunit L [Bacteriovoracaceae bacterium]